MLSIKHQLLEYSLASWFLGILVAMPLSKKWSKKTNNNNKRFMINYVSGSRLQTLYMFNAE